MFWLSEWVVFWNLEVAVLISLVGAGSAWLLFGDNWKLDFMSSTFYLIEKLLSIFGAGLWNLILLDFDSSSGVNWNHDSLLSRFESVELYFPSKSI